MASPPVLHYLYRLGEGEIGMRIGQTHVQKYLEPLMKHIVEGEIDPSFLVTHRIALDEASDACG